MNKFHREKIKNIIFDLDGTLIHANPHRANFIQAFLEKNQIRMTASQIKAAGRWSSEFWINEGSSDFGPDWNDLEDLLMFWRSYLDQYYKILGITEGKLDKLFRELAELLINMNRKEFIMKDTKEVLRSLKMEGYRLGVLSNRDLSIQSAIDRFSMTDFFDCAYSAGELGSYKPNKIVFEKYLEKFEGIPEETVYIGDNYWLDGLGAKNAGLSPVLFDVYDWYEDSKIPTISRLSELNNHLN